MSSDYHGTYITTGPKLFILLTAVTKTLPKRGEIAGSNLPAGTVLFKCYPYFGNVRTHGVFAASPRKMPGCKGSSTSNMLRWKLAC